MTEQTVDRILPDPQAFVTWVKRAMADLEMRPYEFLRDEGVPGAKNRVYNILKNPHAVKLEWAMRLESEIKEAARLQGMALLPLEPESYPQIGQSNGGQ